MLTPRPVHMTRLAMRRAVIMIVIAAGAVDMLVMTVAVPAAWAVNVIGIVGIDEGGVQLALNDQRHLARGIFVFYQ